MKPIFIANWKMNKLLAEARDFCRQFQDLYTPLEPQFKDVGIAPPLTALPTVNEELLQSRGVMIGVQNLHWEQNGAHTGEISAQMVRELGTEFAILGHSERRQFYGESSEAVSKRALASIKNNIRPIVCIGESKSQYEDGLSEKVCITQLRESLAGISSEKAKGKLIIAYEPIWAIGTGLAATPEIAANIHAVIRKELNATFGASLGETIPILYGGSTKPSNIAALVQQKNVNGALVGGSGLEADSFVELIAEGRKASSL